MTVRAALVVELFTRCRAGRPGIEWIEGWPGESPPREYVWLSDLDGTLDVPVFNPSPLTIEDDAKVTLAAISATGGQSRVDAMTNVEAYLTDVVRVLANAPDLGSVVTSPLIAVPTSLRGPYSLPNTVEGGFMATAQLDVSFTSRPEN